MKLTLFPFSDFIDMQNVLCGSWDKEGSICYLHCLYASIPYLTKRKFSRTRIHTTFFKLHIYKKYVLSELLFFFKDMKFLFKLFVKLSEKICHTILLEYHTKGVLCNWPAFMQEPQQYFP